MFYDDFSSLPSYRSQWYKNPYIRGGYSNSTVLCDASSRGPSDLATPVWAEVCCGSAMSECKVCVMVESW